MYEIKIISTSRKVTISLDTEIGKMTRNEFGISDEKGDGKTCELITVTIAEPESETTLKTTWMYVEATWEEVVAKAESKMPSLYLNIAQIKSQYKGDEERAITYRVSEVSPVVKSSKIYRVLEYYWKDIISISYEVDKEAIQFFDSDRA